MRDCVGSRYRARTQITVVFWGGILILPLVLIPTAVILPFVLVYRLYIIVALILRSFVFCCCT